MTAAFTAFVGEVLPAGSATPVVEGAGHFLHLEQPEDVGTRVVEFLG